MRLICPKCAAQYEVDGDKIPDSGREVHCSACGNTWFQPGTNAYSEPLALGTPTKPNDPLAQAISRIVREDAPVRPPVDQSVLDILHEEAARETQARIAEGTLVPEEAQPTFLPPVEDVLPPRGGFWTGFTVVLVVTLVAAAVYVYAAPLSQAIPSLKGGLDQYSAHVDAIRVWINTTLNGL